MPCLRAPGEQPQVGLRRKQVRLALLRLPGKGVQVTRRKSLVMLVPTKSRPENASRLLHACNETAGDEMDSLVFALDPGEEKAAEYEAVIPDHDYDTRALWSWAEVTAVQAEPQRIGPILNQLAAHYAQDCDFIGFMGDDHLPRTANWDEELVASLGGKPGVAYGNDLVQGERIPTACIMTSDLVRSLGYMVPPGLEHLYFDDFWKMLGQAAGNLKYCPDVVIEHLHPTVGTAQWDDSYRQNNDPSQFAKDLGTYQRFLAGRWHDDLADLRRDLSL